MAPSKRKTRQTEAQIGPQDIILARVWWGKLVDKDAEVGTWPPQIILGNMVCVRGAQVPPRHVCMACDA